MGFVYAQTNDGYIFKSESSAEYLCVTSASTFLTKEVNNYNLTFLPISCIIGTIKLKLNKYIIISESSEQTGTILENPVFKLSSIKVLPVNHSKSGTSDHEEVAYLNLINQHFASATLFFSDYDLTNSFQRHSLKNPALFKLSNAKVNHKTVDDRFWWNHYLCQELIEAGIYDYVTPLIYGYVKVINTSVNNKPIQFGLITRRSKFRAGTRYFRRGIDSDGEVANFNETEQILFADNQIYSFLQTRGSVPVYWCEINNLKYKPNLSISTQSSINATTKHFEQQVKLYGENYLVNLVNQKGYEKPVKEAYENAIANLNNENVHYIYFDFHHECRKMRWDRVKILIDHLVELKFSNENFFQYDLKNHEIINLQNQVVRTNCMDCLDRTNVVQSTLGRWFLQKQFETASIIPSGTVWESNLLFNLQFQNIWADNADAVSIAYSGTGALKTDYTRTGKRTKKGALNDLINSITRYIKNNYKDGPRQDAYDLVLGNYKVYKNLKSPFIDSRPPIVQSIPYIIFASLSILFAAVVFPKGDLFSLKNMLLIGGCISFFLLGVKYMISNGYQFVNWPKLVSLDFLKKEDIYVDGKFNGIKYVELDDFKSVTDKKKGA